MTAPFRARCPIDDCTYPTHAGTSGYRYGCRCNRCRTAHTDDARHRHRRIRARQAIRDALHPRTHECVCGRRFNNRRSLTYHVTQTRRGQHQRKDAA